MQRGNIRLLVFEALVFVVLFINIFASNFLSGFHICIFLGILLLLFKCLFGFEKDRHRYTKDIILDIIIFLIVFLLLYYLLGILVGFYKTNNYYSLHGFSKFIFPISCYILLREYLRYMLMCKCEENKTLTIIAVLLFVFLDSTTLMNYGHLDSSYDIFVFISLIVLPALSNNIIFSYITLKVGYKPLMLYALVMNLYPYLLPIVPNPSQYLTALFELLLPVALGYTVYKFFKKHEKKKVKQDYPDRKKQIFSLIPVSLIVIFLVYFTSGYFSLWAIVVASGSMKPSINKGDVVVINKNFDFNNLDKGQIIAYKSDGIIVVHRIVDKAKVKNNYYYITKGDANKKDDNLIVDENMIVGTVKYKIPYIGFPKIWLNGL